MSTNIFVVGADSYNCKLLEEIHTDKGYEFHNLLTFDDVKAGGHYPSFDKLLEKSESILETFTGSIDAIVGYWDFPVNSMVPILCHNHGLPSPTLESELKCDHKYWSRREQKNAIPEHTPDFDILNPFDSNAANQLEINFPFWIKPVKSTDSFLAFKVEDWDDFNRALRELRDKIGRIASPFNELLAHAELPDEISGIDGHHCIVEQMINGFQCTVEGHVYQGEVTSHGVIDSYNYPETSSFFRYEYPSHLPQEVQNEMIESTKKIISHIGFNNGAFNIEYFYNERDNSFKLLEINPRISQSHSEIFKYVDGTSNHRIMVDIALGNKPQFRPGAGKYHCAAKFHLRRFKDGYVTRVPDEEEINKIIDSMDGIDIDFIVKQDMYLSELIEQDSYSYDMAHIYIGAADQQQLLDKYNHVIDLLPIEFQGEQIDTWKRADFN